MPTTTYTRTQNRRSLLASTQVPIAAAKSITTLTRSTTTATAVCSAAHGFSVGDWVIVAGSDRPPYNGPVQVTAVSTTTITNDTFTYTMETDPGATSGGVLTASKAIAASIWGDGTTIGSNVTVGALPSAFGGQVIARVATTTGPTSPCKVSIYVSGSALPGTWRNVMGFDLSTTTTANDMSTVNAEIPKGLFVLVLFWGVAGTAVYADCVGLEDTSYTSS